MRVTLDGPDSLQQAATTDSHALINTKQAATYYLVPVCRGHSTDQLPQKRVCKRMDTKQMPSQDGAIRYGSLVQMTRA